MKTIYITIIILFLVSSGFSQTIPQDSLYLAQSQPGNNPVVFQLQSSSGLRPIERISISSDGKEIYYCEINGWPITTSRIKCYKYISNMWQGPFVVFEGFACPGLSVNDSTMYMQKDVNGFGCTFYSTRTSTGWSTPLRLLSSNLQSHYFQETQLKNYYVASNPGGNTDICKLMINNQDTTIQSLGKPINTANDDNDFFIARDESYIIFFRLASPNDLRISYHKTNGKWTNPKSFGPNINTNIYDCCPYVTHDNKYLFFTRGNWPMSTYSTYWVKVDNIIDSLKHTNYIPYLLNQIPNQTDSVGVQFSYTIPDTTFVDDDGNNTLTYTAALSSGGALPSWLNFNPATRTFLGTPTTADSIRIKVTAIDTANANVACEFTLKVDQHTAIDPKGEQIVNEYKLYQNYPNPFNPSTVIRYSVLRNSFVTVKIYNILGKEIATFVNSVQTSGLYNVTLNSNNLSLASGIYIYTLTATETNSNKVFRETKVMNYIK
ncbi:MAG: putative Ig domain-containing protein [Candidatus Kapaibacterium sp.]